MSVPPGLTVITGDESSGKTTLLRLLAGELTPLKGSVVLNGIAPQQQPDAYRAQVYWVDPRTEQWDDKTAQSYLEQAAVRYPTLNRPLLDELLHAFSLTPHLDKKFNMLSAGTRRKVFLATGFASGAALTLLDTPFAALDKASVNVVLDLLEEAAHHPQRAWVMADYELPAIEPLAGHYTLPA